MDGLRGTRGSIGSTALVGLLLLGSARPAGAQANPELPPQLEEIGVTEHLDARIPLDLRFTDSGGDSVVLGDYFDHERPVLLSLVYYRCPMLCNLVLQGMIAGLAEVDLEPGADFDVVTVSIDPREGAELARKKKRGYVETYGRDGAEEGWHFLTGEAEPIEALADAVGFRYRYVEESDDFAHPAVVFVLTPDGRVSRYLYGIQRDSRTMRLSLVEASEGKVGSSFDRFLLYCYQYDGESGAYAPVAMRLMQIGASATATVLGVFLLSFWLRESRRKKRLA